MLPKYWLEIWITSLGSVANSATPAQAGAAGGINRTGRPISSGSVNFPGVSRLRPRDRLRPREHDELGGRPAQVLLTFCSPVGVDDAVRPARCRNAGGR